MEATAYRAAMSLAAAATLMTLSACSPPRMGPSADQAQADQPTPVVTQPTRLGDVSRILSVSGSLRAEHEASLSAQQPGRLVAVLVREGDAVAAGQPLARVDDGDLRRLARASEAAVASSMARLRQAEAAFAMQTTTVEAAITAARAAYGQQTATSAAAVQSAESALKAAQASLSALQEGARSEEREQTQAALRVAEASCLSAEADLKRYRALHAAGYVSDAEFEQRSTSREVAQANLRAAQAAATMQRNGARRQDLEQAEERVRQAVQAVRQARAGQAQDAVRKADLETAVASRAQNRVRQADVEAARAAVDQARTSLAIARQAVSDAVVRAPFSGRVSARLAEPGQIVNSGAVLLKIVSTGGVYFGASVPEEQIGQVRVGQRVDVRIDSTPHRRFRGSVSRVYPTSSSANRSVSIRVTIPDGTGILRPQAFASGDIHVETHARVVLAPETSIVADQGGAGRDGHVFTVENGTARVRPIKTGLRSPDGAFVEVTGISAGTPVVVQGLRGLSDGARVHAGDQTDSR